MNKSANMTFFWKITKINLKKSNAWHILLIRIVKFINVIVKAILIVKI